MVTGVTVSICPLGGYFLLRLHNMANLFSFTPFLFLFKNQMKNLQGAEVKLTELQGKYSGIEKQNFELSEKVMRFSNCLYT